jgi:uncharacterized protein YjbI with pentapeptide repeats
MADKTVKVQAKKINLDLNIDIKRYHIDEDQLDEFINARKSGDPVAQGSLAEYVKEKFYKDQNVVVVPDLSNQRFEAIGDISGVDFTGCKLTGAWFQFVDLKGAIFCDADLANVTFYDCDMQNVDMRGTDLSGCQFMGYSEDWMQAEERNAKFAGMKFSSTEGLLGNYIKRNEEIYKEKEQQFFQDRQERAEVKQAKLDLITQDINKAYTNLSWTQAGYVAAGLVSGNEKYDKLLEKQQKIIKEKEGIEKERFKQDDVKYIVSPSLVWAMEAQREFDPAYIRGGDKKSLGQEKQYVRMSREDVEAYLAALKTSPNLNINDFAKLQMAAKGIEPRVGAKVVADLSPKKLANGEFEQVDLSELDFTNARLQEACFSGANLQRCTFKNADLSRAIFESADITGATFQLCAARDVNFFYCDMNSAKVTNCDFKRAFMKGSNALDVKIENVNFNYANIQYGKWDRAVIENATFNYADLEGVSLARAEMHKVQMQHAILDKAIINNCKLIECDLSNALMQDVKAKQAQLQGSILAGIEAKGIDFTEAELDELVNLEGANLENAILARVNAERVNFLRVNMAEIDAEFANFKDARLSDVNLRFANLERAILENTKASDIDLTGANLTDINAKKADFSKSVLEGVQAERANFTEANFTDSNLRGSKLNDAILEKIEGRRLDIRNAELERANLEKANLAEAKVNEATNMHAANVKGVTGKLEHHDIDYKKTEITADEQVRRSDEIHKAQQKSAIAVGAGKFTKAAGGFFQTVSEFIKQPFSNRTGAIVGAILCACAASAIAISVVATAGLSIPVGIAVVASVAAVSASVGGVGGYFGAGKIGMTSTLLAAAGTVAAPGLGTGLGFAGGIAGNEIVRQVTGNTIDGHVAAGVSKVADGLNKVGSTVGLTNEQENLLNNKEQAKANYQTVEKQPSIEATNFDREKAKLEQQERMAQSKLGNEKPVKPVEQVLTEEKTTKQQNTKSPEGEKKKMSAVEKLSKEAEKPVSKSRDQF